MKEEYQSSSERDSSPLKKIVKFFRNPGTELKASQESEELIELVAQTKIISDKKHLSKDSIPQKGAHAIVPGWEWKTVVNEGGVRNGNRDTGFGDKCGIEEGGSVTVVGYSGTHDRLLVRYRTPVNKETYGTPCPSGTLFFITVAEFNSWTPRFRARENFRDDVKRTVRDLLNRE